MTEPEKTIINILNGLDLTDLIFFDDQGNVTSSDHFSKIFINGLNTILSLDNGSIILILPADDPDPGTRREYEKLINSLRRVPGHDLEIKRLNHNINPKKQGDQPMARSGVNEAEQSKSEKLNRIIQILKDVYSYTGSGQLDSPNLASVKETEWVRQGQRILDGIKLRPHEEVKSEKIKAYSPDPEVRKYQVLYRYYATLAARLDPVRDVILSNISSRVADHYMFKLMNVKTVMSDHSPDFLKTIQLLKFIGDRGGFPLKSFLEREMNKKSVSGEEKTGVNPEKEVMDSQNFGELKESLVKWFENFKPEKIYRE
jgi:hypothetical protein